MPKGSTQHKLALKGATIMNSITRYRSADLPQLMDRITKNSIGLDDFFESFFDTNVTSNYPPYNLIHVNNVESRLEIALAGFKKKEVKVYSEYGKLYVTAEKADKDDSQYVHKGLAQRSFERAWTISDDVEVTDVAFADGLLTIKLGKIVPEHHARREYL
tara:strand:+ start:77 stop:556 length:480 start_codon:yes stop_codon:yes gene_type:complete